MWNNLQYSDLIVDLFLLAAIAAKFNVAVAVILAIIAAAINAIPEWFDFDPKNVYLDIFFSTDPNQIIHIEVDYFYY